MYEVDMIMGTVAVVVVHAGLAAVWLGAMVYSLFVVQPRAARFFAADDDAHEAFLVTLASGNRRPVLIVIAGLAVSGVLLLLLERPEPAQLVIHATKGALLLAAFAVFADVSWRLWPRRVFALPEERPAHRTALRRRAHALVALVATASILGVLATQIR